MLVPNRRAAGHADLQYSACNAVQHNAAQHSTVYYRLQRAWYLDASLLNWNPGSLVVVMTSPENRICEFLKIVFD